MKKVTIEKNKRYALCSCNQSSKYPFCDGAHRDYNMLHNTNYKSIKIVAETDTKLSFNP